MGLSSSWKGSHRNSGLGDVGVSGGILRQDSQTVAPTVRNRIAQDQLHLPQVCLASAPSI